MYLKFTSHAFSLALELLEATLQPNKVKQGNRKYGIQETMMSPREENEVV